jgi:hypothetical protein
MTVSDPIPLYAGPRIIEMRDEVLVRRYLRAPNAEVGRQRKTETTTVPVSFRALSDDLDRKSAVAGGP